MATNNRNRRQDKDEWEISVSHVHEFDDGNVAFWLEVGRITIYGMRLIRHKKGDFIAFPSYKVPGKKRGEEDRWYNHAYMRLSEQETDDIITMVEAEFE